MSLIANDPVDVFNKNGRNSSKLEIAFWRDRRLDQKVLDSFQLRPGILGER